MGIIKRGFAVLLAALALRLSAIPAFAVLDGQLQLDGERNEYEIWDDSHYVIINESGELSAGSGIIYAGLYYLIDDNRKNIYLYFQYLDESAGAGSGGTAYLDFADGTTVPFYVDGRPVSFESGTASYCVLDLGAQGIEIEAQVCFDTITQAEDALENIAVSFTDCVGRRTDNYSLTPVFPVAPGESTTVKVPSTTEPEDEETTKKKNVSRETTTRKPKSSSKSTTRSETKRTADGEEKDDSEAEERTVEYIVSDGADSDYRVMIATVCALILVIVSACAGWFIQQAIQKKRERNIPPKRNSDPADANAEAEDEKFDDGPEEDTQDDT